MSVLFATLDGVHVLHVRNPIFGDQNDLDLNTTIAVMMSGKFRTSRRDIIEHFKLQFTELTRSKVEEAKNFFETHASQKLLYVDYEGISWRGFVTNSNVEATTTGTGWAANTSMRAEAGTITIDFEGAKIT